MARAKANVPVLETDRLRLRPLAAEDGHELYAAWGDAATLRFWHRTPRRNAEETVQVLEQMIGQPDARFWAICKREDPRPLGHVALVTPSQARAYMGYLVLREHWGRGLATEATRRVLHFAFEHLQVASVELWIYDGNAASVRVAEKLGCTFRSRFVQLNLERGDALPMLVYGVTAGELGFTGARAEPTEVYQITPVVECTDVQAAVEFYTGKLGFTLEWAVGSPITEAAVIRKRWHPLGVSIRFTRVDVEPEARPGRIDIAVSDVDALHRELASAGLALPSPVTRPWGLRELDVEDCQGQKLRFYSASPHAKSSGGE